MNFNEQAHWASNLKARLKAARLKAELTQQALAKLTGIPQATISMFERPNGNNPANMLPALTLYRLAKGLGVSADYLIGLEN